METSEKRHPHPQPQRSSSTIAAELFICFTSRLSSSSMKLSSKSILSPARARDSLSASLSRRLRPSRSLRAGHASPMFPPSSAKKRFDNPEPSSPKVTCIGQVRVKAKGKTKRKKKIHRARSRRRGEASFRKSDPNNPAADNPNDLLRGHFQPTQQECKKWVHLPVTICEALRSFGAEFNCLLPSRSSCVESRKEKEAGSGANCGSSCGGFSRWLVAAAPGEDGERIEIGSVIGEEEEEERESSQRRHVFEDIEINLCENESICIPPKNALLLMRCRSDPVKVAALTNRFWEAPPVKDDDEEEEHPEREEGPARAEEEIEHKKSEKFGSSEATENSEIPEDETEVSAVLDEPEAEECLEEGSNTDCEVEEITEESSIACLEKMEGEENPPILEQKNEFDQSEQNPQPESRNVDNSSEQKVSEAAKEFRAEESPAIEEEETDTWEKEAEADGNSEPETRNTQESEPKQLPDFLTLMMCEPKVSTEVSKETWVCSSDFIRSQPEKKVRPKDGPGEPKRRISINSNPGGQPARSSCSYPAAVAAERGGESVGRMKVNRKGCEPFVLTRCKSEPRRSTGKPEPEGSLWKKPATLGVGAAEIGC